MNPELKTQLKQWYSDRQLTAFFGARSDEELTYIVMLMRQMDAEQIRRFKAQLGATYRQQLARRRVARRGRSTFGRLILSMKEYDK